MSSTPTLPPIQGRGNLGRYFRLWGAFARFSLAQELAFRGNFLAKMSVEVLWLALMLIFYRTVFGKTSVVADWSESEYLFFVGCYFALEGVIETFFLSNCLNFAELVRTGELDFHLLKPIDEQFLISCKDFDWTTAPNVLLGAIVMVMAYLAGGWPFEPGRFFVFLVMFGSGIVLAYSFLLMLTSTSVWLTRNQSMMELWWLFTSLMRYPREIFSKSWAAPVGFFFSFLVPVMLVVSVPAGAMVKLLEPAMCAFAAAAAVASLFASRWVLRYSLSRYRSASS